MPADSDAARAYSREHGDEYKSQLFEMLRIPSLSGNPENAADVREMAKWLVEHMTGLGLRAEVMETAGHPVAYGEWLGAGPDRPTVLVYGHYDVVPASKVDDGWDTEPFEPVEKDGKIYARGATDDKGQLFIHVKALEGYLKTAGSAPVNVKFLIEGEEEVSSPNLTPFIKENLELLACDVCIISDSSMRIVEEPAVTHSLRGMTYLEVHVDGPRDDLHSGFFGGAAHNPANALVEILAQLYNEDNTVAVPGFYDDVAPLSDDERAMIEKTALTVEQFKDATGVPAVWGDQRFTIKERVSARPTLDINGIWGGYAGPGPKTIIPSKAGAKISSRLVGNQDPNKIFAQIKSFIESIAPSTVRVNVELLTTGMPALIPYELPEMKAAAAAYRKGWGHEPVFTRGGGSIPVVADIYDLLKVPVVMMGYGLDSDGLHAANEHYSFAMFQQGIETAIVYLEEIGNLQT